MRTRAPRLAVALALLGAAPVAVATIYPAIKDTCFNKGLPFSSYGKTANLPRAQKGGEPYWDVSNGFLLLDFDRGAILNEIEAVFRHRGMPPTLEELRRVPLTLHVMSSGDMTSVIGVPAVINSASGTNWNETGVLYSNYVDLATGATNRWMDHGGAEVPNLREVMKRNDGLTGGMVRNAVGTNWAAANTYTVWKLDPAVALDFLTGQTPDGTFGVAGLTIVSDGPYYDNNSGAYARESTSPPRGPYLKLDTSAIGRGGLLILR
jgi:hypothetical protein